ncbi:T6SS effector BTH_I2691 family protein [Herbaspirillum sp.]|uniref:T6SS effector BTH_I2691 family protein n=2 Tax=unclassified Herbaspirillum TaxID=2624150 RepID=UPI000C0B7E45|nr:T6SS effector BTH_I2691 family protein [Herbaspirillum sp.]MAF02627.1 hypothetical protein [Herbaspirillum sp.]MBO16959.1 hypothetical protein [Herbaspirillum sp.]|tara:strand:+ start:6302 stop:9511 length:3210 start_codon:yes stop_codon:yes gene_type:complete
MAGFPRQTTTSGDLVKKNADVAQKCALGSDGKCGFCQRTGYPILPLRYAIKPSFVGNASARLETLAQMEKFSAQPLKANRYTLRVLRKGYLHVYLGVTGHWQCYVVTDDGYLRLLNNPNDPDAKQDRPLTNACKRDGHNIPASFIHIPDGYMKIWIGFADIPWRKEVRSSLEKKPGRRMQQVDLATLFSDPARHAGAIEVTEDGTEIHALVDEFAQDDNEYKRRLSYPANAVSADTNNSQQLQWNSLYGNFPRSGQLRAIGEYAAAYHKQKRRKVAALALFDPTGIVQELNANVAHHLQIRQDFGVSVMRPLIVSQSLVGLKKLFEQAAVANREQQEVKDKKPDTQLEPDYDTPAMVIDNGGIPVYSMKISTRQERAKRDADDVWRRIAARYDEAARAAFDQRFKSAMKRFAQQIEQQGGDWAVWANESTWLTRFDDYFSEYASDYKSLLEMIALSISGGTGEDKLSQALWLKWLSGKPDADVNPVFRGLFGNRKELLKFLTPDKNSLNSKDNELNKGDKLYDITKNLLASEEINGPAKLEKILDDRARQWAGNLMATIAAVAARLERQLPPEAALTINRAMQASQYLYSGVSVMFLTMKMTIGDYMALMKERGAKASKAARKQVNSLLFAGFFSINDPKIRDTLIDVTIWTTEKVSTIKTLLQDAEKSSKGIASAALNKLKVASATINTEAANAIRALGNIEIGSRQARTLANDLLKRNVKITAGGEPVLAAGAMYFQWWAMNDSMKSAKTKLGKEGIEAELSLISAAIGVLAASIEALGGALKVLGAQVTGSMLIRVAGWFGLISSVVDSIQAFSASSRAKQKGDAWASQYYSLAGYLFGLGAAATTAALLTKASIFGGMLGLGPLGWAIVLVFGGLFFLWMATNAESTAAEMWADRCYFGKNISGKGIWSFSQIDEEMLELNAIVSGLRIELGSRSFTTRWFGEEVLPEFNVKLRINFALFSEHTSAYEWVWLARNRHLGNIEICRGSYGRDSTLVAATPSRLPPKSELSLPHKARPGPENSAKVVEQYVKLDSMVWEETTVIVYYWPDATNGDDFLAGTLVTEKA